MSNPPGSQAAHTGDEWLSRMLVEFLQAPNWTDARRTLEEHPELLSDASIALLDELVAKAQQAGQEEIEAILKQQRDLLLSSRAHGITDAFSALAGVARTEAEPELRALLEQAVRALERFQEHRDPESLDATTEAWRNVLSHPTFSAASQDLKASVMNSAAGTLLERYWFSGHAEDLEQALDYWQEIQRQTQVSGPERSLYLANLATALQARYERTGDLADLEQAVATFEEVTATVEPGSSDRPAYLSSLATALQARYERTGDLADLEHGIFVSEEAASASPVGSADRRRILSNLANGLRLRFAHMHHQDDIENAVKVLEEAVKETPSSSPELPTRLSNLGLALRDRYSVTGDEHDLDRALSALDQALRATASNSPDLPSRLNSLGVVLEARYERAGDLQDLDRAVEHFSQAADLASHSPDRIGFLSNLADTLRIRFERTNRHQDLERAIEAYRSSSEQGLTSNIQNTLHSARTWGRWAAQRGAWSEAATAYHFALEALDLGYQAQPSQGNKEMWLTEGQEVPAEAAYATAMTGRVVDAVLALERGRAVLLSEGIARDADLERLRTYGHHDLYERYAQAAQQVGVHETVCVEPGETLDSSTLRLREARTVRAELHEVIAEIRQVPGFEFFLALPTFDEIATISIAAPLVYLAATWHGGMALLVENGQVEVIWLPDLDESAVLTEAISFLRSYSARSKSANQADIGDAWIEAVDRLTRWLWDVLMGQLVSAVTSAPRLTLIPSGLLGLLPLHAAWTSETTAPTGRRYVLDAAAVTYAPNARFLSRAERLATRIKPSDLLAVDDPRPLDAPILQYSGPEVEAAMAAFPHGKLLRGEKATRAAVLAAMPTVSVLHFACHSYIAPTEPLRSGLLMAGGELLTLADLLRGQPINARVAVLSASGTAIPGTELPNEVIGLPTGLLQAGVVGVIASQWETLDISTTMLMVRFYQEWQQAGFEPWDALRRAQRWVRDTTNAEKRDNYAALLAEDQLRRLPKVTATALYGAVVLMDPEQRSFADPVHWAGFAYFGL